MTNHSIISWKEDGTPVATQFDDIYFSRDGGLEETRYVFLASNGLADRFQKAEYFTIAETGFGTGLNFLASWQLWKQCGDKKGWLHFLSVEKYPLSQEDLEKSHALWPELSDFSKKLLSAYPSLLTGVHRLVFPEDRISLTLYSGDIEEMLPQMRGEVDAWFLDGFSPAKNPAMWSESVLNTIARLTKDNGTFSTFTAAGEVRRALEKLGFIIEKQKGFGKKREMMKGVMQQKTDESTNKTAEQEPWFSLPTVIYPEKRAVVIGGGLAGTGAAYSLAKRGWKVTILERHKALAEEASGNPAGIFMPQVMQAHDPVGKFSRAAYLYTIRHLEELRASGKNIPIKQCGVLQLLAEDARRNKTTIDTDNEFPDNFAKTVTSQEASDLAGINITQNGIFFPKAGWVSPKSMCYVQSDHPSIRVMNETEVISLTREKGEWVIHITGGKIITAPVVIIANAFDAKNIGIADWLPVRQVRGQLTFAKENNVSKNLQCVLSHDGIMLPAIEGAHVIGATFQPDDKENHIREIDHQENFETLIRFIPSLSTLEITGGRVAFRAVSPDRLPMAGALADYDKTTRYYTGLHHGHAYKKYPLGAYHDGLYVSVAHGSRGITSTPLISEMLASMINNEPLPLEKSLINALNPVRFIIRDLKRKKAG